MKKILAILMALCFPLTALAQESVVTANGVAKSKTTVDIVAPFSGVLLPFDWESGDEVNASDVLFSMQTNKIYSPVDGTVYGIFANSGELADNVMTRYGMLASIQKEDRMVVNASTTNAYNDAKNRDIHAGECIFIEETNDRDNKGAGRVVSVNGKEYLVEVTKGDFEDGDSVKIYRDDTMSSKSCIGSGRIALSADMPVSGMGYILNIAAEEGQKVKQGDLMFELISSDADCGITDANILAGTSGVLELNITGGMQVYKGQLLAKVHQTEAMSVVASVDEMDLDLLDVGRTVSIVFDRYPQEVVNGTVRKISSIGRTKQNAAYYDVTIDYFTTLETLPGMNATVYLSK